MQLLIDVVVLCFFVQFFKVIDDATMQELSELFILALEQFKEDWKDDCSTDVIFSTHDLEACNESHSDFWVQNGMVLLE